MLPKDTLDAIIENASKPQLTDLKYSIPDGIPLMAVPKGYSLQSVKEFFDEYKKKPDRRAGKIAVNDLGSFINIVNRFKSAASAVFYKSSASENDFVASLLAVLDYHPEGPDSTNAAFKGHTALYSFPLSNELKLWLSMNKKQLNQKEFAEFLEDNSPDLVTAAPAAFVTSFGENGAPTFATPSKILELARGIEARADEKVVNAFRASDGTCNIQYSVENKDANGQPLRVPEWCCLGIPVFENGVQYQIPLRLRYRIGGGAVTWWFEMFRKNDVLNHAFHAAVTIAANETQLPSFNGTPE